MTININHMDTFYMLKGILTTIHDYYSAEVCNEIPDLLEQMERVPETDDSGFFVEADPVKNHAR